MTTRRSARLLAKTTASSPTKSDMSGASGKVSKKAKHSIKKVVSRVALAAEVPINLPKDTSVTSPIVSPLVSLADPKVMNTAIRHLKTADPRLGKIIDRTKETCSMALPRDQDTDSSFISLCQSIIFQQLAGSAASAILLRFLKRYGKLKDASMLPLLEEDNYGISQDHFIFPTPQEVVALDVDEMKAVGLGQRKAEYLKAVAEKFNDGTLSDEKLAIMTDDDVSRSLIAIRGIGQWTADMFLMFHLKRPNVLPTLDLAVRKAMCHHFGKPFGKKTPTHDEMVEMSRAWMPYRSVATWYMWKLVATITQKS
ncbi:DNA glycosylase [Coemansia reversa NRRL 1564]|uniref:DNA glycosylase n=1 Tax=Coemansia reversa (strain ATCC 12441 / NRRL 1564) TaxID=763665 RepID=A0A2G5BAB6_COERN|nr:DNA glycosylase [Coemansia reversa NRRL 1564]|eukprot:PIA15932.1 DNA glycosylase [Coemansia reversa NRRL 1564]